MKHFVLIHVTNSHTRDLAYNRLKLKRKRKNVSIKMCNISRPRISHFDWQQKILVTVITDQVVISSHLIQFFSSRHQLTLGLILSKFYPLTPSFSLLYIYIYKSINPLSLYPFLPILILHSHNLQSVILSSGNQFNPCFMFIIVCDFM